MMQKAKAVTDLDLLKETITAELNELKKKRGAGRPRADNPGEKKIKELELELAIIDEQGRRATAEDLVKPPLPAVAITAQSVLDDPQHHTPPVNVRRAMSIAVSKRVDGDGDAPRAPEESKDTTPPVEEEGDDDNDGGDNVDDNIQLHAALDKLCHTPDAQKKRNKEVAVEFASSRAIGACKGKPFTFPPPYLPLDADLKTQADHVGLCSVVVWHPPSTFGTAELPCPRCGWDEYIGSDKKKMKTKIHDWTPGRRVIDVDWDVFLVGAVIHCKKCRDSPERQALVKAYADSVAEDNRAAHDKGEPKAAKPSERTADLNAKLSQMPYSFRSYDPTVMKMYCER